MFYKRKNSEQWHGPGRVIGEDGKQILVKHGFTYVRVQTRRITHPINSDQNEIHRTNHDYRKNSGSNETKSSQMKSRDIAIDSSDEKLSQESVDNSNINVNVTNQNNDTESPVHNNVYDILERQGEVDDLTKSISRLSIDENSDSGILTYNKHLPSKNEYTEYKTENDNTWNKCQFISRAAKATVKYKHYFNVLNLENNSVKEIDWQTIKEWRSLSGRGYFSLSDAVLKAKMYEIEKWKKCF